jgi:hypothetical protein
MADRVKRQSHPNLPLTSLHSHINLSADSEPRLSTRKSYALQIVSPFALAFEFRP